jgi:hypothetical protein
MPVILSGMSFFLVLSLTFAAVGLCVTAEMDGIITVNCAFRYAEPAMNELTVAMRDAYAAVIPACKVVR